MVSIGDKVYQKYYDPQDNPWRFLLEMTPGNIDLENNIQYAINATVSLNSGLSASSTKTISVYFDEVFYDVFAEVLINKDIEQGNKHLILEGFTFGDWLARDGFCPQGVLGGTGPGFIMSVYYYVSVNIITKAAKELGENDDYNKYNQLKEKIYNAIY